MFRRASRPLVREPVGSRPRTYRWDFRPLQLLRDTAQDLLDLVPLYLDARRRVALVDGTDHDRSDTERDAVTGRGRARLR